MRIFHFNLNLFSHSSSRARHTRSPAPWLEILNGILLIAWGVWMVAATEPANADVFSPWTHADKPSNCLASLMPLWIWGSVAIFLGLVRLTMLRPIERLRFAAFLGFAFWTLVASLFAACSPTLKSFPLYVYAAIISGITTLHASRRIGENGAGL